jgi:hypothetical protein
MGTGWYVALEREIPGAGGILPNNGRALLFAQHHLEEIARACGLPSLKEFFSSDPAALAAYLRDQGIDADPDQFPDEQWFDADDLLPTLDAAIERLREPPVGLGQIDKVREGLAAMEDVARRAAAAGVRIHIATGFLDLSERGNAP